MWSRWIRSTALAAGMGASLCASGTITVRFVEPQRYTDVGRYGGYDVARTLNGIERHLRELGDGCIAESEVLEIRVHDVDLAGQLEGWRPNYDLRVMREVTWPRMDVEYVWRDAGDRILAEGRERVSDMHYLLKSLQLRADSDPLAYDKAMLTEWFEPRFCRPAGSS